MRVSARVRLSSNKAYYQGLQVGRMSQSSDVLTAFAKAGPKLLSGLDQHHRLGVLPCVSKVAVSAAGGANQVTFSTETQRGAPDRTRLG